MHLAPGDPIAMYINPDKGHISPQEYDQIRHDLGLDRPLYIQYMVWLKNTLRGDWGYSIRFKTPVVKEIAARLPNTILLGAVSIILTLILSIPIGILSAIWRHSTFDYFVTTLAFVGISIPGFWLALILMQIFAYHFGWLPSIGMETLGGTKTFSGRIIDVGRHLILPAISLSVVEIGYWVRFQRSALLEVLNQDYIRTARAKGLRESKVILRHAFRNSMIPMITLLGLTLPDLVTGAYLIETVFGWPGMGRLGVDAIVQRDYPIILAVTMLSALIIILSNLLSDILYTIADPRIHQ
jgi:peptide/nickel transport system permease protein